MSSKQVLFVKRYHQSDKQTRGEIELYSPQKLIFQCKSLELPWKDNQRNVSRIPNGYYNGVLHNSPKFGECVWIQGVPNRNEILIHKGNFAGSNNPNTGQPDILGCILAGRYFVDIDGDGIQDVAKSSDAMDELVSKLDEEFTVIVQDLFS